MSFLNSLFRFENSFSKNITKDVLHDPSRLITGVDPGSTKVWNTVLGQDKKPLVNVFGSPDKQYYDKAGAEGIDTGAANKFHKAADVVAGFYGAQGLAGIGGGSGEAAAEGAGSGGGVETEGAASSWKKMIPSMVNGLMKQGGGQPTAQQFHPLTTITDGSTGMTGPEDPQQRKAELEQQMQRERMLDVLMRQARGY